MTLRGRRFLPLMREMICRIYRCFSRRLPFGARRRERRCLLPASVRLACRQPTAARPASFILMRSLGFRPEPEPLGQPR